MIKSIILSFLFISSLICISDARSKQSVPEVDISTPIAVNKELVKDLIIYPGNTIEISVYEEPDLSLVAQVSPEGTITYPLLGQLKVSGLTVRELEKKLTRALAEDYLVNPQVRVSIKEFSKISILGQVVNPGMYELRDKLTVTEAIALAGGLTPLADPNRVKIIRIENDGKEKTILVRVKDILKRGKKSQDILLQPNDMVVVPERHF